MQGVRLADVPVRTVDAAMLRIIDSLGVAAAALGAPPARALRQIAPNVTNEPRARLWGSDILTPPGFAALSNGGMVRYLDMNDAYTMTSTAHPSDNLAGLIALAEALGRDVSDAVLAATVSYEVQCRLCDAAPFHLNGWDQPLAGAPGAAMGAAALLGLDAATTHHALSLAVTPNLPTYQTRHGTLSMWKGLAGPNGARAGIEAAIMAEAGITAPENPFDGPAGVWALITGDVRPVNLPGKAADHVFAIEQSDIKLYPVRNAIQLPLTIALDARRTVAAERIASIDIWTTAHSFEKPSKDPALWAPETRESADHSLPFCVAAALIDGEVSVDTFVTERYLAADIRDLMSKINIHFDPAFDALAPSVRACRLVIRDTDGELHTFERHWRPDDPMRQPDRPRVLEKAEHLARDSLTADAADRFMECLRALSPEMPAADIAPMFPKVA